MNIRKLFILIFLLTFINLWGNKVQKPMDVIKKSNQDVKSLLKGNKKIDECLENKLYKIIDDVTSYENMAKESLKGLDEKMSKEKFKKFKTTFEKMLRISSIKKAGRYRADSFKYVKEEILENKQAIVYTIASYKEDSINLNYILMKKDKKWYIINYIVDDIDTVKNYRKQFIRLLNKKSPDAVIKILEKRINKYKKMI